jgi:hypothetical protein
VKGSAGTPAISLGAFKVVETTSAPCAEVARNDANNVEAINKRKIFLNFIFMFSPLTMNE